MNKLIDDEKLRIFWEFGLAVQVQDPGEEGCSVLTRFLTDIITFFPLFSEEGDVGKTRS